MLRTNATELTSVGFKPLRAEILDTQEPLVSLLMTHALGCGCSACCESRETSAFGTVVSDFTALLFEYSFVDAYARWNGYEDGAAIGVTFVTYSFFEDDTIPALSELSYNPDSAFSYSEVQRANTRLALAEFSAASGVIFIEVEDGGMLELGGITGSTVGGYANYPSFNRHFSAQVFVNALSDADFGVGSWEYYVLLHEIGHAMGLKHPFDGPVVLTDELDTRDNTVMSYTAGLGSLPEGIQALDVEALQFLYGAPADLGVMGVSYSWDAPSATLSVSGGDGDDNLSGINFRNTIDGGGGHDLILGAGEDDTLTGGLGNDILVGDRGEDTLIGGAGNDDLRGGQGNDYLEGGDGDDALFDRNGNNTLIGGDGDDVLEGGWGNDVLDGGAGDDVIRSSSTQLNADAGSGDDLVQLTWGGTSMVVTGGEGLDTLSFALAAQGIWIDLQRSDNRITDFEIVLGSDYDDNLTSGDGVVRIDAGRGDDTVRAGSEAETLIGGEGFDFLSYSSSDIGVVVDLEAATGSGGLAEGDTISGFEGIIGTRFDDTITGDGNNNVFIFNGGNDTLDGAGGLDLISFEYYFSPILVDLDAGVYQAQASDGNFYDWGSSSFAGFEGSIGGLGDDQFFGDAKANHFQGRSGNDSLSGLGGNDLLEGGDGNDTLNGDAGVDTLEGGAGDDILRGGADIDVLRGGEGADFMRGGTGDDLLDGGAGNDSMRGDDGNDRMFGLDGDDYMLGGEGDDYLVGNAGDDLLIGGNGNDNLQGREGNDRLYGEAGDDEFYGFAGEDELYGGDGNDFLAGYEGNDLIYGDGGNDLVYAMDDDDLVYGGAGDDFLIGNGGNDTVYGEDGNDNLRGRDGNDALFGGAGNDFMLADGGNDTLSGGAGFDTLFGGAGSDTFVFEGNWRRDTVADWSNGEDKLDLSALGLKGAGESTADAFAKLTLVQDGTTAIISVTGDTRNDIRLANTDVSTLDASDFLFEAAPAASAAQSGSFDFASLPLAKLRREILDTDIAGVAEAPASATPPAPGADQTDFDWTSLSPLADQDWADAVA